MSIVGDILSNAGSLAKDIREAITGDISSTAKAELELKAKEIETSVLNAQAEINMEEAKSGNLFLAGWRPALGWLCVSVLALHFFIFPIIVWILKMIGTELILPSFEIDTIIGLLAGILGILRTVEKKNGTSTKGFFGFLKSK